MTERTLTGTARRGPRTEVISFGSIFLEIVFGHLDRLPLPGEEIYVDPFAFSCGGAVTIALEARRAGASAGLATVLGDDLGSRLVVERSVREGVDLSPSRRVSGPVAGITVVLNFNGDRAFVSHMPPAPPDVTPEIERWLEIVRRERPAWCYLHANDRAAEFLHEARALGTRVALDLNFGSIDSFPGAVVECARLADLFLPNEEELLRLTRLDDLDDAMALAASWCPRVVVKRGPAGAIAVEDGRPTEVTQGLDDVVAMDRTGAGDAFAGALIGSLVRGADLLEAVAAGNRAGSRAVARLGAVGEMPVT
ncbi:MAG: carbohydrate kinase family protein [Acidimicrobiales bacterium]